MWLLDNTTQNYEWGSLTAIPSYLGEKPTGKPVAEVWMGTHPLAPSQLSGTGTTLRDLIESDPQTYLGISAAGRWGDLPFLVKLLASRTALSIQVHPSAERAAEGYALEEASGIDLRDPRRTYKDKNAKPEAFYALESSLILAGFRQHGDAHSLLGSLDSPWAQNVIVAGEESWTKLIDVITDAHYWTPYRADVIAQCLELGGTDEAFELCARLDEQFPGDPGVVAPLVLNCVHVEPGHILYTPPGIIHAHVESFGIEIMATSDNVSRAGLTTKYVDREALMRNAIMESTPPQFLHASGDESARVYSTPADKFDVQILNEAESAVTGPRILVALTDQKVTSASETLFVPRGSSVFVGANEGAVATTGCALLAFSDKT